MNANKIRCKKDKIVSSSYIQSRFHLNGRSSYLKIFIEIGSTGVS